MTAGQIKGRGQEPGCSAQKQFKGAMFDYNRLKNGLEPQYTHKKQIVRNIRA